LHITKQFKYAEPAIQATSVQVKGPLRDITIAAVYCPPRYNLKVQHFEAFLQTFGPSFLAGGDFNSKNTLWGSRLITTKGRELAKVRHHICRFQNVFVDSLLLAVFTNKNLF
jgi:hypothetical protein